jgi:hypothetical protein
MEDVREARKTVKLSLVDLYQSQTIDIAPDSTGLDVAMRALKGQPGLLPYQQVELLETVLGAVKDLMENRLTREQYLQKAGEVYDAADANLGQALTSTRAAINIIQTRDTDAYMAEKGKVREAEGLEMVKKYVADATDDVKAALKASYDALTPEEQAAQVAHAEECMGCKAQLAAAGVIEL